MSSISNQETGEIYSVSQLTSEIRQLLENHFAMLWIEGEILILVRRVRAIGISRSKDDNHAACAMFRLQNRLIHFTPQDGQKILLRARVSLYEGRGDFQLIAEFMEENGLGALQRAFEALKQRLAQEGLFDPRHKKPLPSFCTFYWRCDLSHRRCYPRYYNYAQTPISGATYYYLPNPCARHSSGFANYPSSTNSQCAPENVI